MRICAKQLVFAKRPLTALLAAALILAPGLSNPAFVAYLSNGIAYAQTVTTYTYDNNGNMLSRTTGGNTDTFTYDAENRLISANIQSGANSGISSYTYDDDGLRTSATTAGATTSFLLDKNRDYSQVVLERTGSTSIKYTHGHRLISQDRNGLGTRFHLSDGQLSTRQLTSTTGGVTDTYTYDAFGVTLASTGATPNVYLYTGEQLDPNVDLYYLRARYYSQATGRFITTDPLQGNIVEASSLHRYLYANANPVSYNDPSGENPLALAVIAAVGALIAVLFIGYSLVQSDTPRTYDFRPRSDQFRIRFCNGATVVYGLGGGETTAVIAEKRDDGKAAESARYEIAATAAGLSTGYTSAGAEITFSTKFPENVKSFQGYGSVASGGFSAVVASTYYERHYLPDAAQSFVDNPVPLSGGVSTRGKGWKGFKPSAGAYVADTTWTLVGRNESLDRSGFLQCPGLLK